jgi:hypothetical protein
VLQQGSIARCSGGGGYLGCPVPPPGAGEGARGFLLDALTGCEGCEGILVALLALGAAAGCDAALGAAAGCDAALAAAAGCGAALVGMREGGAMVVGANRGLVVRVVEGAVGGGGTSTG